MNKNIENKILNTEDIISVVTRISQKYFDEQISILIFNKIYGYKVSKNALFYAKKIGLELRKKKIPFESCFDVGQANSFLPGTKVNKIDPKMAQYYINSLKKIPSPAFLRNRISPCLQKKILLKTVEKLDLSNCIKNLNYMERVAHIFKDYENIGIDPLLINEELTSKISQVIVLPSQRNFLTLFIQKGFAFNQDVIKKIYIFNENDFLWIEINQENSIKIKYEIMKKNLPVNKEKVGKNKI